MDKLILLVDDEAPILRALKRVFRRTDYQVLTADNAEEALRLVKENTVSVIVSDYTMPTMTRAELLSRARELKPDMSRLILSGNSDQASAIKSINDGGALKFLTKPWDNDVLKNEVDIAYQIWLEKQNQKTNTSGSRETFLNSVREWLGQNFNGALFLNLKIRNSHALHQVLDVQNDKEILRRFGVNDKDVDNDCFIAEVMDDGTLFVCLRENNEQVSIDAQIQDFIRNLEGEIELDGSNYKIQFNAGYAICDDSDSLEQALNHSAVALNQVALSSHSACLQYDSGVQEKSRRALALAEKIEKAMIEKEFYLVYQPKVRVGDNTTCGAEALLRWESPELGKVSPAEFIPVVEDTGLITELGQWVMESAVLQWKSWFQKHATAARVSVNVSPKQLREDRFLERVSSAIEKDGLAPDMLELEITESVMMEDIESAISVLNEIKSLGITISIDDFGTGYSSLNYLHRLPLDVLKIDRSFIQPILEKKESQSLVRNLISLGKDLNMELVAEGVEEKEQLEILHDLGCEIIQGYYFSPPLEENDFLTFLENHPISSNTGSGFSDITYQLAS